MKYCSWPLMSVCMSETFFLLTERASVYLIKLWYDCRIYTFRQFFGRSEMHLSLYYTWQLRAIGFCWDRQVSFSLFSKTQLIEETRVILQKDNSRMIIIVFDVFELFASYNEYYLSLRLLQHSEPDQKYWRKDRK